MLQKIKSFFRWVLQVLLWGFPFLGLYFWDKLPTFPGKVEIGCGILILLLGLSAFLTPRALRGVGNWTNRVMFWTGLAFVLLVLGFYYASNTIDKNNTQFETVSYVGTVSQVQSMGEGRNGEYFILYMDDGTPILDAVEPRLKKTKTCVSQGLEQGKKYKFTLYKTELFSWVLYRATKCTPLK